MYNTMVYSKVIQRTVYNTVYSTTYSVQYSIQCTRTRTVIKYSVQCTVLVPAAAFHLRVLPGGAFAPWYYLPTTVQYDHLSYQLVPTTYSNYILLTDGLRI